MIAVHRTETVFDMIVSIGAIHALQDVDLIVIEGFATLFGLILTVTGHFSDPPTGDINGSVSSTGEEDTDFIVSDIEIGKCDLARENEEVDDNVDVEGVSRPQCVIRIDLRMRKKRIIRHRKLTNSEKTVLAALELIEVNATITLRRRDNNTTVTVTYLRPTT